MNANSRTITTNQRGIHDALEKQVQRHLKHPFQRPVSAYQQRIFEEVDQVRGEHPQPLILDSGCGVGESTRWLADQFPDHWVLGIDKSAHRLAKGKTSGANFRIVRADLIDFWLQAAAAGWEVKRHYLLYPNPYPKATHLKRRWHGHPIFTSLIQLGEYVEVRSNWRIYVEEFQYAYQRATGITGQINLFVPRPPVTPFERKYHRSGQSLYQLIIRR
ncbi:MAG: SAM-dependent methyltransferase [Gemmatimonadetes bacterium]|nr:MAG: SAM-dependent methyltransferase [Gemmatimonadota bacterium]